MYSYLLLLPLLITLFPFTGLPWIMKRRSYLLKNEKYEIRVLKGHSQINAFSVRGLKRGYIFLTENTASLGENNVNAVIAHEIGHLEKGHHVKMALLVGSLISLSMFFLLNGMSWIAIPILLFTVLTQKTLTRKFELEADKYALKLVPSQDLANLISSYGDKKSTILSTHPDILTRLKNLNNN